MTSLKELPQKYDLITAIADHPLGEGTEAQVFKIHTMPKYTVRVSTDLAHREDIPQKILESNIIIEKDIFEGRFFGQTVAYLDHPDLRDSYSKDPLITINYYSKGHDYTIVKDSSEKPTAIETLSQAIAITKALVDKTIFPDKAYDDLFDKLKFLSSKHYTIDVGNGLFCNTGNILPSVSDHKFFLIDVMPFLPAENLKLAIKPAFNPNHTKGFNSPLYLSQGLLYGYLPHQSFHRENPDLLDLRIQLLNRIVDSAIRSNVSDRETYSFDEMAGWKSRLSLLGIPNSEQQKILQKVNSITDMQAYRVAKHPLNFARIGGWYINQQ